MEIIKSDKRFLLAQSQTNIININLGSSLTKNEEEQIFRFVSEYDVYENERNESDNYRFYGNINYLNFLSNKKTVFNSKEDLFNDDFSGFSFNELFDIFIYKPIENQEYIDGTKFALKLEKLTTTNSIQKSYLSFAKNIFKDNIYYFNSNLFQHKTNDIIIINNDKIFSNILYIVFVPKFELFEKNYTSYEYIRELNSNTKFGYSESDLTQNIIQQIIAGSNFTIQEFNTYFLGKLKSFLSFYDILINTSNINLNINFIRNYLNIGNTQYETKVLKQNFDILESNLVNFNKNNYTFETIINKEYVFNIILNDNYLGNDINTYIQKNYKDYNVRINGTLISIDFEFYFNPIQEIILQNYGELENEGDEIPINAIENNNEIIWRDLIEKNNILNSDFTFINNTHYIYNNINFYIKANLSHKNTFLLFNNFSIEFTNNLIFNNKNIKLTLKSNNLTC
jgi:hypothetical protein